jgi:hypothetical protein
VRALQQIALGHDASGTTRDRLGALKEPINLGLRGYSSYLEGRTEPEMARRWQAIYEARQKRDWRSILRFMRKHPESLRALYLPKGSWSG